VPPAVVPLPPAPAEPAAAESSLELLLHAAAPKPKARIAVKQADKARIL
jgi:hypothetical protein